jgi:hypothetical protein
MLISLTPGLIKVRSVTPGNLVLCRTQCCICPARDVDTSIEGALLLRSGLQATNDLSWALG